MKCTEGRESSCMFASGDICTCDCGGENHGVALDKGFKSWEEAEKWLKEKAEADHKVNNDQGPEKWGSI